MSESKKESRDVKIYSVLTGDIIGSRKISAEQKPRLPVLLRNLTDEAKQSFPGAILYRISIFRGDSWQIVIKKPELSLDIALFYRVALISQSENFKMDSRIGIGIGSVDFLPDDNISEGTGEAFSLSGQALERIEKEEYLSLRYSHEQIENYINIILGLIDTISRDWSPKQAFAVKGAILGLRQKDIAKLWDPTVSQQTVTRHLNRAGWTNLEKALNYLVDISQTYSS